MDGGLGCDKRRGHGDTLKRLVDSGLCGGGVDGPWMEKDLAHGADIDSLVDGAMNIAHLVGERKERGEMNVFVVRKGLLDDQHVVTCPSC